MLPKIESRTKRGGKNFGPTWPEVTRSFMSGSLKVARDLTRIERAAIHKLVTSMCANYDNECGCLPLDCSCYMLNKWQTGNYCTYFEKGVLPLNPILEATLLGREAPKSDVCAACGRPFIPMGKQAYCSEACQAEGNRLKSRERMRKKRHSE